MTLDHIAVYFGDVMPNVPFSLLRMFGRMSAPLFMFSLITGAEYSTDRKKYLHRLYLSNIVIAITVIPLGLSESLDMLGIYFLTLLYICVIDKMKNSKKINEKLKHIAIIVAICFMPYIIDKVITEHICHFVFTITDNIMYSKVVRGLMRAFFPNLYTISYSPFFVIMGILLYYSKNKFIRCGIIISFSVFAYIGEIAQIYFNYIIWPGFFRSTQIYMVLSIPFIILYNDHKGKGNKYFFYIYYPSHIFILALLSALSTK